MFTFPGTILSASTSTIVSLTYSSAGDTNGLFYYLGTNGFTTTTWNNPSLSGYIITEFSTAVTGLPYEVTDRLPSTIYTENVSSSAVIFTMPLNLSLRCTRYTLRAWQLNDYYPRSWKLQGSNNKTTWTDLQTVTNNTTLSAPDTWYTSTVNVNTGIWKYIQIILTNVNSSSDDSFTLGEVELYGQLTISSTLSQTSFTWVSDGDTNGLFYYLGTNLGTASWLNPVDIQNLVVYQSSYLVGDILTSKNAVDRNSGTEVVTDGSVDQFIVFALPFGYKLVLNRYTIQDRDFGYANNLSNWKFQGSNDLTTWTDLDTVVNYTAFNGTATYYSQAVSSSTGYRFFRLLSTGVDSSGGTYIAFSNIEVYGTLTNV